MLFSIRRTLPLLLVSAFLCALSLAAQADGQLQIVAHEDDDLYFMTPSVPDGIATGDPSWTVFITAGDAGRTDGHWQSRELGIRATYAAMAGLPDAWTPLALNVSGRALTAFALDGAPQVVVVFLRLPDGNGSGTGYPVTFQESLRRLWEGTISTIHSIDGAQQYTKSELTTLLSEIIRTRNPETLRIQDMTDYHGSDHSDHVHSGRFAFDAHLESGHLHRVRAYRAYNISAEPVNLSPSEIAESNQIITTYGAFDAGVGPTPWNQREIPIADVRGTQANLVHMGSALGDVCLTGENVGLPGEALVFSTCADTPDQAFYLTERDIRHGARCVVSPAPGGSAGSVGLAPCGTGAGQGWMFFSDGHIRGLGEECLGQAGGVPILESCAGTSRVWEAAAKAPFDAGSGSELSALEFGTDASRYKSFEFGDLDGDGDEDVCVRRSDGVYCALALGDGFFATATRWIDDFGDTEGWAPLRFGTTIQLGDLNGDGRSDLCGRGFAGLLCVESTGTGFTNQVLWTSTFSDADGGASPEMYGSIRLADIDGDSMADVCGYRAGEVQCLLSDGASFGVASTWMSSSWVSLLGLPAVQVAQTMMLGDVDGDGRADLCERGTAGVYCALANTGGTAFVDPALRSQGEYSDARGWAGNESFWGSIRLGDFSGDGQADICGRGGAGALCLFSMDGRFSRLNHRLSDEFSNALGYGLVEVGTTFSLADVDGDGRKDLCAAGPSSLRCAVLDDPLAAPEPGFGAILWAGVFGCLGASRVRRTRKARV